MVEIVGHERHDIRHAGFAGQLTPERQPFGVNQVRVELCHSLIELPPQTFASGSHCGLVRACHGGRLCGQGQSFVPGLAQ
jgi:hypothetical protein